MSFELFKPGGFSNEGKRNAHLTLSKRGIAITKKAIEEMETPDYVKVYIDVEKHVIALVPNTTKYQSENSFKIQYKPNESLINNNALAHRMTPGRYTYNPSHDFNGYVFEVTLQDGRGTV